MNFYEQNQAPCSACGATMPIALLECPGEIGNRKYVCYACCGRERPSERGIPREMVDGMMAKYGKCGKKKAARDGKKKEAAREGKKPDAGSGAMPAAAAIFHSAMDIAESAVMEAERQGISIEGAAARASNLSLDCADMDRAAGGKGTE